MAKTKKSAPKPYGKREENAIAKITPGDQKAIQAHATKWNRTYDSVYQKVRSANGAGRKIATHGLIRVSPIKVVPSRIVPKKIVAVAAGTGTNIATYVLEEGAVIAPRSEADIVKDRLRPYLNAMEVYDATGSRHAIAIETSKTGMVRHFLNSDPEFAKKAWTISTVVDNPKVSRIFRKA